jgi:molybdate transport system substrate-binding protein
MKRAAAIFATALTLLACRDADAAELKVASAGAFRLVLGALSAPFERETGDRLAVTFRTVGQHVETIRGGEEKFDVALLTPEALDMLERDGKVLAGSRVAVAKVGIGVVIKAGAPLPDIGSVEAFKRTLLAAKSVAYLDPKAGGSSGIYVAELLQRLGIADAVNAKAKLVEGGAVADYVANGEADIGIHQISEILPVAGAKLVGPVPAEIQHFTAYSAAVSAEPENAAGAQAFVRVLAGPQTGVVLKANGMEPPP